MIDHTALLVFVPYRKDGLDKKSGGRGAVCIKIFILAQASANPRACIRRYRSAQVRICQQQVT